MMDLFALLDELQTIARNGLTYARDPYDRERYERLLALAACEYSRVLAIPEEAVRERFAAELGYITPKVGADAAIFNDEGEILLVDRSDGTGWCLPCGFVEPNESPAEAAARECREETGLEVRVKELVGVFTRKPSVKAGPHTLMAVVYLCEVMGGVWAISHESRGLRYWKIEDVPRWHQTHEEYARAARAMWERW